MRFAAVILLFVAALFSGAPSAMLQAQDLAAGAAQTAAHDSSQKQAVHAGHAISCEDIRACKDHSKKQAHPSSCSACIAIEPIALMFDPATTTSSRLAAATYPALHAIGPRSPPPKSFLLV
ncbi:hypothetical protein ASD52_07615 [Ensifer sp. Root142]|uniref:hypothetical protein n=1 Tax=Ensifer sp. Root142 TaxID=1736461 RepID=UPI00070E8A74|nr:hypothetical protein [Ensifer sp. Root142]KQY71521.1 hypothetical protein ASD52_07615 [Ensifer sp. Root142]